MLIRIDYIVIAAYFGLTLALGLWSAHKAKRSS